jgi:hypothetical protein
MTRVESSKAVQLAHGQATLTSSEDDPSLRFAQDLLLDFVASGVRFAVIHWS